MSNNSCCILFNVQETPFPCTTICPGVSAHDPMSRYLPWYRDSPKNKGQACFGLSFSLLQYKFFQHFRHTMLLCGALCDVACRRLHMFLAIFHGNAQSCL